MRRDRGLRRVPRDLPPEHSGGRAVRVLARVPVRLARHPRSGCPVERRARLRPPRARVRAPQPSLPGAQPPLRPVPPRRGPRRVARRAASGRSCRPASASMAGRSRKGRSSRRASPGCAATSASRCATVASSSPATPRTSCRPPARRASTSRSTTCACWPRRSPTGTARAATTGLDAYSDTCLRRVWRAEHFSWWMTQMLHRAEGQDAFDLKLQLSQLRYVTTLRRRRDLARRELRRARDRLTDAGSVSAGPR